MRSVLAASLLLLLMCAAAAVSAKPVLEPFEYFEDFETRSLRAWAAYPLWQDTAYDPNFRVNEIVPGDPNISIVQIVTPYTNVDSYAGAQKLFDIYLVPGSKISLRFYLKTNLEAEFFKVRLAAGEHGKVDYTIESPRTNGWEWVDVAFADFVRQNPCLAGAGRIEVNALAVLAKIPDADPKMPIYLGLDDIAVRGARVKAFKFAEPVVHKLSEFRPHIADKHYRRGDELNLRGRWDLPADKVTVAFSEYTDSDTVIDTEELEKEGDFWILDGMDLDYSLGMYRGRLTAYKDDEKLACTDFTFVIAPDPEKISGVHPRLWFDAGRREEIIARLKTDRFSDVYEDLETSSARWRERLPVDEIEYLADQFPAENWLPTLGAWGQATVRSWRSAVYENALAYAFRGDREAGRYAVELMAKVSTFPDWNHPWLAKRGRYNYHPTGVMAHYFALAYDLTYDLMTPLEQQEITQAFFDKMIVGTFRTYVEDDMVTCDTSNWISHVVGGPIMMYAAMYGDRDLPIEPYFSGHVFKQWHFIDAVHGRDGAYGEGFGYNGYTYMTLQESLPALENVFGIDMHGPMMGTWDEAIWGGIVQDGITFHFGDSRQNMSGLYRWTWLIDRFEDPTLKWLYDSLQNRETIYSAIYDIEDVSAEPPFNENPNRVFRSTGTTVFRSGWQPEDFIFVLRTGPFFNHQHIDQGTFWLTDRGTTFITERHGSDYYDDPHYQTHYTQPVGHSTILIDGNEQSQRVGDHRNFAGGFEDYAFVSHYLDGANAAFTRGDIGRLYWDDVESMQRNVLYLKPRTLLMLDTVTPPEGRDVDVTVLYQTEHLEDIDAGPDASTITRDGTVLSFAHLAPERRAVEAVRTPHYLDTLLEQKPLIPEGMLTVTSRTEDVPLVMANVLTTAGDPSTVTAERRTNCMVGTAAGERFAFSTLPGEIYEALGLETDALAVTVNGPTVFAAMTTRLSRDGSVLLKSEQPVTLEHRGASLKYYHCVEDAVTLGIAGKPESITVNGEEIERFLFDPVASTVTVVLPAGEGTVAF